MCACVCLYMNAHTLEGHLEHNCSLVFHCCPSGEMTGGDEFVTATCRLVARQYFSVSCANWDFQANVSSCAAADDSPLGFSACFLSNPLSRAFMDYYIINVYTSCSVICSFPSIQFLSGVQL